MTTVEVTCQRPQAEHLPLSSVAGVFQNATSTKMSSFIVRPSFFPPFSVTFFRETLKKLYDKPVSTAAAWPPPIRRAHCPYCAHVLQGVGAWKGAQIPSHLGPRGLRGRDPATRRLLLAGRRAIW